MITADDLEFHTPPDAGHNWAETYFFPIAIPEQHLLVTVYVVVRPGLGVMVNDIAAHGAVSDTRADLLYFDVQPHLPAPARWSAIDAPSGLAISAVSPPRGYRIDYEGYDDTEIHVEWTGVMEPFDIHDPTHSPRAAASAAIDVGAPWNPYAATVTYTAQLTWFLRDQVGHGCIVEIRGIPGLTRRHGRWWTDQPTSSAAG